ncbi:Heat shock transcription factor, variant 2 [Basidiobolus ranarum]
MNFASKVLPRHYETNKFSSFSRQLNLYGFHQVSDKRIKRQRFATSTIVYAHQHFKRDKLDSLHLIQRMWHPYSYTQIKLSNLQPTSQQEGNLKFKKASVRECQNCRILTQEIAHLNKMIEYCKFILHKPPIVDDSSRIDYSNL